MTINLTFEDYRRKYHSFNTKINSIQTEVFDLSKNVNFLHSDDSLKQQRELWDKISKLRKKQKTFLSEMSDEYKQQIYDEDMQKLVAINGKKSELMNDRNYHPGFYKEYSDLEKKSSTIAMELSRLIQSA